MNCRIIDGRRRWMPAQSPEQPVTACSNAMMDFIHTLLGKPANGKKIFGGTGLPAPDFKIVATHVRSPEKPRNYVLDDPEKMPAVVEKWRFEPKPEGNLSRCGYDYQIVFTNGGANIPVSICFLCNTLILNHSEMYKISRRHIESLLRQDFKPV